MFLLFFFIVLDYLESLNVPCPEPFPIVENDLNAILVQEVSDVTRGCLFHMNMIEVLSSTLWFA